jgi:hypothetical protein
MYLGEPSCISEPICIDQPLHLDAPICIGDAIPSARDFHRAQRDHVQCSEMRIGRDVSVTIDSRSDPSLHDVRYHAPASQAIGPGYGAELFVRRTSQGASMSSSQRDDRDTTTIEP